jgi:hypothetical protein
MAGFGKALLVLGLALVVIVTSIVGAYWRANTPPKRPANVSSNAVFLWAGHLGLPAPRHGTWIECWADADDGVNKCRLTEMDGTPAYEGVFLVNTGRPPLPQSDLQILSEQTSQSVDLWVRVEKKLIPLVFLRDGAILIPKDAYQEGMAKLEHLRQVQGKNP